MIFIIYLTMGHSKNSNVKKDLWVILRTIWLYIGIQWEYYLKLYNRMGFYHHKQKLGGAGPEG
jgi:hypothetical protein